MSEYRKGIEEIPLRKVHHHLPIYVILRNLRASDDEDDVIQEFKMDMSNKEDRMHLSRLTVWAVTNHHSVETLGLQDAEGMGE